jgi:hypothetical protein
VSLCAAMGVAHRRRIFGSNVMDPPLQHGFYEPEWFQG